MCKYGLPVPFIGYIFATVLNSTFYRLYVYATYFLFIFVCIYITWIFDGVFPYEISMCEIDNMLETGK